MTLEAKSDRYGGFIINDMAITLDGDLLKIHDLNPEVCTQNRITRLGLAKLGLWCLRQAMRKRLDSLGRKRA